MAKLTKFHNMVYSILETNPETRSDDFLLFYEVLKDLSLDYCDLNYIFKNHAILGVPSFETITRCRRKIQHDHPELSGAAMRRIRKEEEKEFKAYALSKN